MGALGMYSFDDRPSDEEIRLFLERIAHRLAEQPLDLAPATHRERVAGLLRQAGEASFSQILSLPPTAAVLEIHESYERTARLVHPQNAVRLGLAGREGVLEMLFERATQAYLTLSQPERRKRYDRELSPEAWTAASTPVGRERKEEARTMARHYYERAVELVVTDDYYFAVELVQQAVRIDPRPEYHALLGKLQAKNQRWVRSASENLQKAIDMGSRDAELPVILEQVRAQLEGKRGAREDTTGEIEIPLPEGKGKSRRKK
jgi:curved DNA-binding protein CbpA